jgi:hypothetical protein
MEVFYTDKGKLFECQIQVEGAESDETKARLIMMFENKRNLIFFGDVDSDGTCQIQVPALKDLKEGKGTVVLEVISDSTIFEPWEAKFELKPSKKVTVEVKSSDKRTLREQVNRKPTVKVVKKDTPPQEDISEMVKQKLKQAIKD